MRQTGRTDATKGHGDPQRVAQRWLMRPPAGWFRAAAPAMIALGCAACNAIGPRQLPFDRFDYNSAIANSANEQMLLNLVRLRFNEIPVFLAVNSVLTQYVWSGDIGVAGASGESNGFPAWSVGGSGSLRYIERPTVTYSPLNGQEFASQLINPVRAEMVFSLISSGWPPDQLLLMTLQRINNIENQAFVMSSPSGEPAIEFSRVVNLIIQLFRRNAIELTRSIAPDESLLDFAATADPETQSLMRELKSLVELDPASSRFRITRRIVGRGHDEVTIRMHSLVELMGLLSTGVETPAEGAGDAGDSSHAESHQPFVPLRVHCVSDRPVGAFVAVEFRGHWYYLADDDRAGKQAFGLLNYLFQMQASQNQGAGPLLTVPIG